MTLSVQSMNISLCTALSRYTRGKIPSHVSYHNDIVSSIAAR